MQRKLDILTNIVYVIMGAAAISMAIAAEQDMAMPIAFGVAMILLGLGSGLFHSGKFKWSNHADVISMYIVGVLLVFMALGIRGLIGGIIAVVIAAGVSYYTRWELDHIKMEYKIGVLYVGFILVAALASLWRDPPPNFGTIGVGIVIMVAALVIRFPLANKFKESHAVWHLLTGVGLFLFYRGVV